MGIVSRLKLDHPALGTTGGAALHTQIDTIYKKIGDMSNARMFTQENLSNGAYVDFDHNFNSAFDDLRFDLYLYNSGTGEMTEVEALTGWTITATPGFVKTKIRVANATGSSKTIALVILQDPIKLDELTDVETTGVEDGQTLVYDQLTTTFKPGASGDSSFKFQKLTSGGVLTVKKGFLILSNGVELRLAADIDITLGIGIDGNYYGYIYRNGLAAATVVDGRKIIDIVAGNFEFSTNAPDGMDRFKYIPIGLAVRSGGVWTSFATLATRAHSLAAGLVATYVASTLTATQGKQYIINTNSAAVTLNIPDGKVGLLDAFGFKDGNDFSVTGKNLILKPASDADIYIPHTGESVIGSANETLTIDIKGASGFLHYNGTVWVLSLGGYTPIINSMTDLTVENLTVNQVAKGNGMVPAGMIGPFAGSVAPIGWFGCDGSVKNRSDYPDLFNAIGTVWDTCYNPLDGSQYSAPSGLQFRLPDLRGTFLRGAGDFADNTQDTTLAGFQSSQNLSHVHIYRGLPSGASTTPNKIFNWTHTYSGSGTDEMMDQGVTASGATESRPQNVGVKYIIKY